MEISRESLEKVLKIHMDKVKFKLCLNSYQSGDYIVQLADDIRSDFVITKGDVVSVKIRTEIFGNSLQASLKRREQFNPVRSSVELDFDRMLEVCLRAIPRMFDSIAHPAVAEAIGYDSEKRKAKRYSKQNVDSLYIEQADHPYVKEVTFSSVIRARAVHWKSGIIAYANGRTQDEAKRNVKEAIMAILLDKEMYERSGDKFITVESHEDIIADIVDSVKQLTDNEIVVLINKLIGIHKK